MYNGKMIAMMLTLSMLAASLAGCAGGDDDDDWAITKAADTGVVWVESGWDPIIPNLNDGTMCDVIISAMTKTATRDEVVDFTRAYYTSSQGVIGGTGVASVSDVSELNAAGITVGVQSGTTSDIFANGDAENDANLPDATVSGYEDFPSVIAALNNGDVMYALGDAPVLSLEGTLMTQFSDENFGFAVREDSGELLDALNMAIGAVVSSGEYDIIFGAHFEGAVILADDTTADTATAYPTPTKGSTLTGVLESGQLKVCTDPFYPPFESYDADNNVVGFDADVAHAVVDEIAAHYMGTANPVFVPETTKIGLLNPMTGPIAEYAPPFTWSAQAAIDDLNAMGGNFELVEADSGCSGDVAATAAQTLVDAGVVGVAGAACSGASIAANAVLSAAGVVQVSYASTSPALSNSTAYPNFWRVVPSDEIQGPAMKDMADAAGATNPALLHMTNDYGSGLATAFENAWGTANLCTKIGYEDTTTDFTTQIQAIADAGCSSVVAVTYATDGAAILEQMAGAGVSLPFFGADGIADSAFLNDFSAPAAANGVQATKPSAGATSGDFNDRCAADSVCAGGIYTGPTYDAVMMIGKAAMHEGGSNMATHMNMVGTDYAGASGVHTFDANGDVPGAGYDMCRFDAISSTDVFFSCRAEWDLADPVDYTSGVIADKAFTGQTVKIGFLNPMTGPIAQYAPGFTAASAIALNIMNIAGWGSGLQFELVVADSGCNADVATAAATTLASSGVVGVVGAACSGATMAANAVLSAAGIPMISYASTSPALTNSTAYPHFFRVVPSDELQGPAIKDTINNRDANLTSPALVHMTNDYGSGLATAFENAWGTANLCTKIGYEDTTTDFTTQVQAVADAGCDSIVLISYAADGAAIVEQMNATGLDIPIFGGDGVAEEGLCAEMSDESLCDGIVATKPSSGALNERMAAFGALCSANTYCAGGIYTSETFDALIIMGYAYFAGATSAGLSMSQLISATGQGFVGATGVHSFDSNGDVPGYGYCIGDFTLATDGSATYTCTQSWALADPLDYTSGVIATV